jgi:hypothetical protein
MKFGVNGEIFMIISEKNLSFNRRWHQGKGQKKKHKYIYTDQLLFLLPIMQGRDTPGNITPPSVNESEAQDITTENQVGERSHVKDVTYTQQKKRSKNIWGILIGNTRNSRKK